MGRKVGSKTSVYKFKTIEYDGKERNNIEDIKLFTTIGEIEKEYKVSRRTLPKFIDNDDKRYKLNNVSIIRLNKPIPKYNVEIKNIKTPISYNQDFIKSI